MAHSIAVRLNHQKGVNPDMRKIRTRRFLLIAAALVLVSGCADYSGEAAQLRVSCSHGNESEI
jgi:hypothetical protein